MLRRFSSFHTAAVLLFAALTLCAAQEADKHAGRLGGVSLTAVAVEIVDGGAAFPGRGFVVVQVRAMNPSASRACASFAAKLKTSDGVETADSAPPSFVKAAPRPTIQDLQSGSFQDGAFVFN